VEQIEHDAVLAKRMQTFSHRGHANTFHTERIKNTRNPLANNNDIVSLQSLPAFSFLPAMQSGEKTRLDDCNGNIGHALSIQSQGKMGMMRNPSSGGKVPHL